MGTIRLAQHAGYIFIVRTAMTPRQIGLVQDSFRQLSPQIAEASRIFYEEVFRLSPGLRALFPEDLSRQREKFTQMIGAVILNLHSVQTISDDITELGHRHMAYEIDDESFDIVGDALLRTLDRLLGGDMSPELRDSWLAAYDMIARVMKEASTAPRSAESFFARIIRDVMTAQYGLAPRSDARPSRSSIAQEIEGGKVIKLS